jgi:hypothetical protein
MSRYTPTTDAIESATLYFAERLHLTPPAIRQAKARRLAKAEAWGRESGYSHAWPLDEHATKAAGAPRYNLDITQPRDDGREADMLFGDGDCGYPAPLSGDAERVEVAQYLADYREDMLSEDVADYGCDMLPVPFHVLATAIATAMDHREADSAAECDSCDAMVEAARSLLGLEVEAYAAEDVYQAFRELVDA